MFQQFDPVDNEDRVLLEVRTARTGEEKPEAMAQFLSSLTNVKKRLFLLWKFGYPISLEMAAINQRIHFFLSVPSAFQNFVESQLISQYAKSLIIKADDYLPSLLSNQNLSVAQIKLGHGPNFPLRTMKDFKDVDPMSSLLGVLAKARFGDQAAIQFLLLPIGGGWQRSAEAFATRKSVDKSGASQSNPYAALIQEKIAHNGFKTAIRIAATSDDIIKSEHYIDEVANSFSAYNYPNANFLVLRRPFLWQKKRLVNSILNRSKYFMPAKQVLNVQELAAMFHFPTMGLANIPNISWHQKILSDPPENLPVAESLTEEEKADVNFFAKTEYKNKSTVFGIKKIDRRRHIYIIGKSGTGKSTLIANMAVNDMRNNRGFCIIDPHGDLCTTVLDYVPSYRVNDVIYLDPSDSEHAFSLNPLEVKNHGQSELVVSSIVAIFRKLYDFSWGPRLEYILRNTLLSIIGVPDATFLMIPEILTNNNFRKRVVDQLSDPVVKNFWINEFNTMPDRMKAESLSPILNKVGQFLSAKAIRNIVKNPKSTIDLQKIMDDGKILLLNLSQGKLGEDNAALLGAMTITQLQLAAMGRVNIPEEQRRDFYLYVDEFQNFATSSFTKILSEARKFRLALILANQYIAQVPEDVRSAVFGNAGTMLSFLIGAEDTPIVAKEFSERFKEEDLLALGNHRAIIKVAIDGTTQAPFLCQTLPLPKSVTQNKEKVIKRSQEIYMNEVSEETVMPYIASPKVEEGQESQPSSSQQYNNTRPNFQNRQIQRNYSSHDNQSQQPLRPTMYDNPKPFSPRYNSESKPSSYTPQKTQNVVPLQRSPLNRPTSQKIVNTDQNESNAPKNISNYQKNQSNTLPTPIKKISNTQQIEAKDSGSLAQAPLTKSNTPQPIKSQIKKETKPSIILEPFDSQLHKKKEKPQDNLSGTNKK